MTVEDLDALLYRMEAIAAAVNAFSSEAVQLEAFSSIVAAFESRNHIRKVVPDGRTGDQDAVEDAGRNKEESGSGKVRETKQTKARRPSRSGASEWQMVKDIDLQPAGKISFEQFIEEKKPASNEDKYPIVVYYLIEILGLDTVTINHVGTVFRLVKSWKEPNKLITGIRMAASRKGTLDAKNTEDIKLTPTGRNFVGHDLPAKAKGKK